MLCDADKSVLWQKAFLTFGKFSLTANTFSTSGLFAVLGNKNRVVVAFLTSAFSTFSGRSLHTRLFYGIFLSYFLYNTGSSQAFNQLQDKVASGNISTRSFIVNNSRVQCCNVNYWLEGIKIARGHLLLDVCAVYLRVIWSNTSTPSVFVVKMYNQRLPFLCSFCT